MTRFTGRCLTPVLLGCTALAPASVVGAAAEGELVITRARVFDGRSAQLREDAEIVIAGGRIVTIRAAGSGAAGTGTPRVIDAGNRIVIPGLIDAHVHPTIAVQIGALRDSDPNYVAARSAVEAQRILMRGFTTIRDMAGPAFGLKQAIDEGLLPGPRIFPSGAMVSQTSGHGDFRARSGTPRRWSGEVDLTERLGYGLIADGGDEVAAAVREQLRAGASQIKLAAGGGISSLYDPIDSVQYFEEELHAAVRAAADWGTYVAVHAYTPAAIRRAVQAGVRSIEHAHLIDEATMKLIAERGVFLSPQAYLFSRAASPPSGAGATAGAPPTAAQIAQRDKALLVGAGLDRMMRLAKQYGVKIAFGTDVFGSPRAFGLESLEFGARLRWFTPLEILRQATSINGELLAMSGPRNPYAGGKLGVLEPGAWADLLVVDGNPLEDVRILEDPDRTLRLIVKDGRVVANRLD
ncbi:MAG: amidohydrolase family protein [Gammaproteobacteria bacterium]|nr:amidohydrolase family protein [Gammaproteobacteria bacterium]